MQRIASGDTSNYVYFMAVDSSDLITFETGLSTWTVYRSRNGAAEAAWTTPTISEIDATNTPGLYALLMDEDTTLDAGDACQVMAIRITHAGMAPATILVELFRPPVSAGETLTVSSGIANAAVQSVANNAITAAAIADGAIDAGAFAADAITAAKIAADVGTEIGTAVWATTTRALTILDEDSTTLDLDATIRAAVGLASANLDTQLTAIDDFLDTEIAAIKAKTDNLPAAPAATGDIPSAATIADAVWDEDATAHQTQGTFGQAIGDPAADADSIWALVNTNLDATVSSRLASASYTSPLSSAGTRGALGMASANLDTQLSGINTLVLDVPTNAELSAALATADDATLAAIAALNNLSAAQVNAEVVDALATDTYAEPGQGTPGATISLATKINYLYAALRNKSTVTATEHKIFADDGTTVIVKRTLSDDATTFSSTELATGA